MNRYAFSVPVGVTLLALAVTAASCGGDAESENDSTPGVIVDIPTASGDVTPRPRRTPIPSITPSPTPLKVCAPNPDPAAFELLQVQEPSTEQRVKVPFHVRGWGSNIGFEGRGLALAVVNAKQEVTQVLDLPPQPREYRIAPGGLKVTEFTQPFAADVVINGVTEPTPYCLWLYLEATASGSPRGVVQIPVIVTP
jgi:hypothetical protein